MAPKPPRQGLSAVSVGLIVLLTFSVSIAFAVHNAGMMEVDVDSHGPGGDDVRIVFPAFLAHIAISLVPSSVFEHIDDQALEWMPVVADVSRKLEEYPDFVLVEVTSRNETVLITKKQGTLVVEVESDDENVHVALPLSLVGRVVNKLQKKRFDI